VKSIPLLSRYTRPQKKAVRIREPLFFSLKPDA
jgi:hypothetical protein